MRPIRLILGPRQPGSSPEARPWWLRYAFAVISVAIGFLAREALTSFIGSTAVPFVFFFPAIAIAAWYGGFGPGLFAVTLSALTADWFFFAPLRSLEMHETVSMLAFLVGSGVIVSAIEATHRARGRLVHEIDQRITAETDSANAHGLLATTLASIGDGVIATDVAGGVTFMNAQAELLTGWRSADAIGKPLPKVFRVICEHTREPAGNLVEKVLSSGPLTLPDNVLLVSSNASETPISDSAAPIRNPDGTCAGVVLVFRDATEQRKTQETYARLAAIVQFSGDAIITKDLNGIIRTWNVSAERLFGYKSEEIIGKPVTTLFPQDRLKEEDHILGKLRQGQPVERLETIRVARDGRRIPVAVSISPIKSPDGRVIGASKILQDISEMVAAREALAQEKELLDTTLASIGDGVIVTDEKGLVTSLNASAEGLTGWTQAEAVGRPLPEVFHILNEETRQPVENPVDKALRLGTVVGLANHTVLIRKDGAEVPIDDSAAPIRRPGGPLFGVVLVFRDCTEQRRAAEALRAKEAELEAIINETPFMLTRCGRDLRYRFVSRAYAEMLGRKPEEIAGRSIADVMGEEALNTIQPYIERVLQGTRVDFESAVPLAGAGVRFLHVNYTPETDDLGNVTGWIASIVDITQRKQAEEALSDAHAQLANRALHLEKVVEERTLRLREMVSELQHLSYAITHDMRAPLRAMNTFASAVLEEVSALQQTPPQLQEYCRRIIAASARLDKLIQDSLNYTKTVLQELPLRPIDLAELIPSLIETYPNLQPEKADIAIEDPLPLVWGEESRLTQCFSNLLGNAVKFVPPGVRPQVRIRTSVAGGLSRITIEDNGIGIPPQAQPRLFGMFQRLNAEYEGTGIGLAIVRKVVERMGGRVGAESKPGAGSQFWVELQTVDSSTQPEVPEMGAATVENSRKQHVPMN